MSVGKLTNVHHVMVMDGIGSMINVSFKEHQRVDYEINNKGTVIFKGAGRD